MFLRKTAPIWCVAKLHFRMKPIKRIQLGLSVVHAFVVTHLIHSLMSKRDHLSTTSQWHVCLMDVFLPISDCIWFSSKGCLKFNNCLFSHTKKYVLLHTVTMCVDGFLLPLLISVRALWLIVSFLQLMWFVSHLYLKKKKKRRSIFTFFFFFTNE